MLIIYEKKIFKRKMEVVLRNTHGFWDFPIITRLSTIPMFDYQKLQSNLPKKIHFPLAPPAAETVKSKVLEH